MLMLHHSNDKEGGAPQAHTNVGTWAPVTLLRYCLHVRIKVYGCIHLEIITNEESQLARCGAKAERFRLRIRPMVGNRFSTCRPTDYALPVKKFLAPITGIRHRCLF